MIMIFEGLFNGIFQIKSIFDFTRLDTSLPQRRGIAGLITAELKLFSSTKLNNSFRTPYVSLSVPGFQKSDRELEKKQQN